MPGERSPQAGEQEQTTPPGKETEKPSPVGVCGGGSAFDGVGGGGEVCAAPDGTKSVTAEVGVGAGAEAGVTVKEVPKEGMGLEGSVTAKRGPVGVEGSVGFDCNLQGADCHVKGGVQAGVTVNGQGVSGKVSVDDQGNWDFKWKFKLGSISLGNDTSSENDATGKNGLQGKIAAHVTKRIP